MPYNIRKVRRRGKVAGYGVYKADTGEAVAGKRRPLTLKGAKGYAYHASASDRGPGGHVPDGTGPHGLGMGPGGGRADGSGLKK